MLRKHALRKSIYDSIDLRSSDRRTVARPGLLDPQQTMDPMDAETPKTNSDKAIRIDWGKNV